MVTHKKTAKLNRRLRFKSMLNQISDETLNSIYLQTFLHLLP